MLEEVAVGILTSFGTALTERFTRGKGEAVEVQPLTEEVRELMASQERTEIAVKELTALFRDTIERIDGLEWAQNKLRSRASVRFEPTAAAPTLVDALMNLDRYIEQLSVREGARPPAEPEMSAKSVTGPEPSEPPSPAERQPIGPPAEEASVMPETSVLFAEIERDIQRRRSGQAGEGPSS
ncbi:hypothetical protein AB0E85_19670 [Streptomyces sp. NPDC029044]|uniref:hypothetical protein n=1 Tax=Streptomyces sp. NPDC029044 TaxID=3157198 RepID=UPI0033CA2D19